MESKSQSWGAETPDSCTQRLEARDSDAPGRQIFQPWKAHWPPPPTSEYYFWLQRNFPEVLSWKFNPKSPFEKPWRSWLHTSRTTRGLVPPSHPGFAGTPPTASTNAASEYQTECSEESIGYWAGLNLKSNTELQRDRKDLDNLIHILQLPSVRPNLFGFLAPLDIYDREKPYKYQVPGFEAVGRTNVESTHRPVTIYDISSSENFFNLAESGFCFTRCPVQIESWAGNKAEENYISKLSAWLKDLMKCESVLVYDYQVSSVQIILWASQTDTQLVVSTA